MDRMEEGGWLVADRSLPAYYYPLVWFLNHPKTDEGLHRSATMHAFWVYAELSAEQLSPFEKELSEQVPDEQSLWKQLKQEFASWVLTEHSEGAERSKIERALFVGALAPFPDMRRH